ncbi:MAG: TatD family hydrolase [Bacteroidota bacterium]
MTMIDTHAHIYLDVFDPDLDEMMERAVEENVEKIYMPNVDDTSIDRMFEVEEKYDLCFCMMGLHPCSVNAKFEKQLYIVEDWLGKRSFSAIGEIGTDLYWDKAFWEQQKEAFKIQVEWAKDFQLPVAIHCRESINETIVMVEELKDDNLRGVFHCFTGDLEQAHKIIELGFYLGIGGISTFKNGGLDKVLPEVSLDHLVLETDSPYLAPTPYRGKRNEPSYVGLVAAKLSELKGISLAEVKDLTTKNANQLFTPS